MAEPSKGNEDLSKYQDMAKALEAAEPAAAAAGTGSGGKGGGGSWAEEEHETTAGDKQLRRFRKRLQRAPHQVLDLQYPSTCSVLCGVGADEVAAGDSGGKSASWRVHACMLRGLSRVFMVSLGVCMVWWLLLVMAQMPHGACLPCE